MSRENRKIGYFLVKIIAMSCIMLFIFGNEPFIWLSLTIIFFEETITFTQNMLFGQYRMKYVEEKTEHGYKLLYVKVQRRWLFGCIWVTFNILPNIESARTYIDELNSK